MGAELNKKEIKDLLSNISNISARKAAKHGVHYYEHNKNGHYRSCPEAFVVNNVYENLSKKGWRITAEAHQGGIWGLFDKKDKLPEGKYKNRYDLALWGNSNKPVAVCEFKWGFSQAGFRKDAENLFDTGKSIGVYPILCLLVVKPDRRDLDLLISNEESFLSETYGILASDRSKVYKTPRFFCGTHYKNKYSYTQVSSFCLQLG